MTQTRPLVVSALALVIGVAGFLVLVITVAMLSGAIDPGEFRVLGRPQPISRATSGLIALVISGLFFACAYGLWKLKRWGLYLVIVIILLNIVSQVIGTGGTLVIYRGIINGWERRITLGIVFEAILLLVLLSSPIRQTFQGGRSA